jgi:HSP20 family molecular chaperone IbpA
MSNLSNPMSSHMSNQKMEQLEKVEKTPVEKTDEMTWAAATYRPDVDIWESREALTIAADMPGVRKEDLGIDLRDDVLTIQGRVQVNEYEGLRPLYGEYNVGNFYRRFTLSDAIDQERISANIADGVLTLTLPKRARAVPRRITVG